METKFCFLEVKKIDELNRSIDAVASTIDMDRDKEIILPSAFEASIGAFKSNPVILACHQHRLSDGRSPVIGSADPESIKIDDKKVTFTMTFAKTDLGEEYWQLYRDKHMRAFSIGFIPIEWKDERDEKLGWIRTFTKIELLEISAVPVPSNRRALTRASKGFADGDDDQVKAVLKDILAEQLKAHNLEIKTYLDAQIEEIKSLITDSAGFAGHLLGDDPDSLETAGKELSEEDIAGVINNVSKSVNERSNS
jgi:HK97 family phage prohead protease